MKRVILQFIFIICFTVYSYAGALIDCPDCGTAVSERAVMCPQCGCPASGIIEAVELKRVAEKMLAPYPVVRVRSDRALGYAVAIKEKNISYLMMDSTLIDGAESLSITLLTTNRPVRYKNLQLAQNMPFARFVTTSTDVISLSLMKMVMPEVRKYPLWLTSDIFSDCLYTGKVDVSDNFELLNEDKNIDLVATVDVQTNLVGLVCYINKIKRVSMVTNELEWVSVSPLDYRNQTKLLIKAENMGPGVKLPLDMVKQLGNTKWATDVLKKRAEKLFHVSK